MATPLEVERMEKYAHTKLEIEAQEGSLLATCSSHRISKAMAEEREAHLDEYLTSQAKCQKMVQELHRACFTEPVFRWDSPMLKKKCELLCRESRLWTGVEDSSTAATTGKKSSSPNREGEGGKEDSAPPSPPSAVPSPEVISLLSILEKLKERPELSDKERNRLTSIQLAFETKPFDKRDLRRIVNGLELKLSDEIDKNTVLVDTTKHDEVVERLHPEYQNTEHLLQVELQAGNMELAEEISQTQVSLLEKLLEVTEEQYPLLGERKDRIERYLRERRWSVFQMANKDISGVIESKNYLVDAASEDLETIERFRKEKELADRKAKEEFHVAMVDSDDFLQNTTEQQMDCFTKLDKLRAEVQGVEDRLSQLGQSREAEMRRRIELCEEEAARVGEHLSFLRTSTQYEDKLKRAINFAKHTCGVCEQLNEFLLYGCDLITDKLQQSEANIQRLFHRINKQHLTLFSEYAVCAGRLRYRWEKRRQEHTEKKTEKEILLEFSNDTFDPCGKRQAEKRTEYRDEAIRLTRNIDEISSKLNAYNQRFEVVAKELREAKTSFVHPMDLLHKVNTERRSQVVEMRDVVNATERKTLAQIDRDHKAVKAEMEAHRLLVRDKEEEAHRRHVDYQAATRNPRPPRSTAERMHAASFNRYKQLVDEMKREDEQAKQSQQRGPVMASELAQEFLPPSKEQAVLAKERLPESLEGAVLVAKYNYKARAPDELTFSKGDRVVAVQVGPEEGWFYGVVNQTTGLFPVNYVGAPAGPEPAAVLD